jgi:hypothetical protein
MKRHRKDKEQAEDVSASMKTPRREAFSDFFTTNLKMHLSLSHKHNINWQDQHCLMALKVT